MKKTLALVLALVMVLALVPTAFAAKEIAGTNNYIVQVEVVNANSIPTIEDAVGYQLKDEDKGASPAVELKVPYGTIKSANNGGLWDEDFIPVWFAVYGMDDEFTTKYNNNYAAKVNGEKVDFDGTKVAFIMDNLSSANATYTFNVEMSADDGKGNTLTETMSFTLTYVNTTKPVYELKFGAADGAVLKDGIYFIDSATDAFSTKTGFDVAVTKNDGSKFDEKAYYNYTLGDKYVAANQQYKLSDSELPITGLTAKEAAQTVKVSVETQYAIYQGDITIKYRKNVVEVDPKGVYFAKDTYTIGINEVLKPGYISKVTVYHDLAAKITLSISENAEKNIIDVNGKEIIGLNEGTAYVHLVYKDTKSTYTDTAKIVVSGTYQVVPKANYVVTTKSGNLNVRAAASTSAAKIGTLKKGDVVEVVEVKDGWAKIVSTSYTNGYVSAQYITKQSTSPAAPIVGEKTVIARVLNVRSGAGTSYSIVGKLTRNTKVEVIETVASGKWAKISFNGGTAYVSTTYIQ